MKPFQFVLLLPLLSMVPLAAQEPPKPPVSDRTVQSAPEPRVVPRPARPRPVEGAQAVDTLSANYTVKVQGTLAKGHPLDVVMRGNSGRFSVNLVDPMSRIEIRLIENDDGLLVTYAVGGTVQLPGGQTGRDIRYHEVQVTGSFKAKLGEMMTVLEQAGGKLGIEVSVEPSAD